MENSGYTHEDFIEEMKNFKGFDHIAEQESALINKIILSEKRKTLNMKVHKVKAKLVREDIDDLKNCFSIDSSQTISDILNKEVHKAIVKDKRKRLKRKLNKVKNTNDN
jgi:hypothetical protein